jgi:hypothetical protein
MIRKNPQTNEILKQKGIKGFIHNGDHIFATRFIIYEDGMIDCWQLVDIEGFKQYIKDGWICLVPPIGSRLCCDNYDCTVSDIMVFENDTEEKILHTIQATIAELNGANFGKDCLYAFENYNQNKTEENRKKLEVAYLKVPEQERRFLLGSMDDKDTPIRVAIWGEKEWEGNPRFAVAKILKERGIYL